MLPAGGWNERKLQMANMRTIAEIVAKLSAAYPNWNVSEYTVEVYYQDLHDIPDEELQIAAQHCRAESGRKFAPSTGELRGAVAELRQMSTNVPTSFQAWQEVLQQIVAVGSYGTPAFSNPVVDRAVRALGWRQLCLSEDPISDRARFIQCYEQLLERALTEEMLIPEVRGYLEFNGAKLLSPMSQMKLLSEKLGSRS